MSAPTAAIAPGATVLLAWVGAGLAIRAASRLHGTTLVAPAVWGALAMFAVAASQCLEALFANLADARWMELVRFMTVAGVLTPGIAELGAKRPQDRGWQFIVASLWIVLLVPAIHWYLSRSSDELVVAPAWSGFLAVLIVFPALGYLPTKFWLSAGLWVLAQAAWLDRYLPHGPLLSGSAGGLLGTALGVAAIVVARGISRRTRPTSHDIDRVWIDFRDMFGAVWALRVLHRFQAESTTLGWRRRLHWEGFVQTPSEPPAGDEMGEKDAELAAIRHSLRSLLRRFVSAEWLDSRLSEPDESLADRPS